MESNFINILISVVAAVFSGVIVRFLGELWKERYLDPIHAFKVLRGRIEAALMFYKNRYTVLWDERLLTDEHRRIFNEVSRDLRALASELASTPSNLPKFRQGLPNNESIIDASKQLIGLSNNVPCVASEGRSMSRENREHEEEIRRLLGLKNKS